MDELKSSPVGSHDSIDILPRIGRLPNLLKCVNSIPDVITANGPSIYSLVQNLFDMDASPIDSPIPLNDLNQAIEHRAVRRVRVTIYEGEWPETRAIPNCDIPLPVNLFVSAPMLKDWRKGRGLEPKGGMKSEEVVRQYAAMSPDSQPAVRDVDIVIDPDGGVFLVLQGDGTHRLCASKMRGDRDILCRGVTIVTLS